MADQQTGQLTLPTTTDGRTPAGMKTKISGAGQRISRTHDLGDKVVLVLEGKVKSTGHEETNDGVLWVEAIKTLDLFELPEDVGRAVLAALREGNRSAQGEDPIPGTSAGSVVDALSKVTDESGVVYTPTEQAERSHDLGPDSPVVLVFDDGSRGLWPDDWSGLGQSRGALGGQMRRPGSSKPGDTATVIEYLDNTTGESLGKWSIDDDPEYRAAVEAEAREKAEAEAEGQAAVDPEGADDPADPDAGGPFDGAPADPPDEEAFVEDADGFAQPATADELAAELEAGRGYRVIVDGNPQPATGTWDEATAWAYQDARGGAVLLYVAGEGWLEQEGGTPADEDHLPGPEHFGFVDRKGDAITADVKELDDRDLVLTYLKAEQQGRGRGLKPRKGVLELLEKRAAALFSDPDTIEAPPVDAADLEGFEVPEDAEADSYDMPED